LVPNWYHLVVDVNVKGLEPAVVARLAEQAAAEGMSQQEWIRQLLRRASQRPSPAELVEQRATITPMTQREFDAVRVRAGARRHETAKQLGAGSSRR
jgi:hypothetical protein